MGVDLKLLPVLSHSTWFCHEIIGCDRDRDLFAAIADLGEIEVGQEVWCHYATAPNGESCYGSVTQTPYGTPVTWLPAGKLAPAFVGFAGWRHDAVRSYLAHMPAHWPVVLWWC